MRPALLSALYGLCLIGPAACKSESPDNAAPASRTAEAATSQPQQRARLRYGFAPAADLSTMTVTACFDGRVPRFLDAQMPAARRALITARRGPAELAMTADGLDLSALAPGDCIELVLDLDKAARTATSQRKIRRHGRDLMVSPDYFLWRPSSSPGDIDDIDDIDITASFDLPQGMTAQVPWPRAATGDAPDNDPNAAPPRAACASSWGCAYRVPATSFHWGIQAALGYFQPEVLEVGGARIQVAILGDSWRVDRAVLLDWLRSAAGAVSLLWDAFPVPRATIILYPQHGGRVGFGWTTRGGGPSIAIGVGTDITAATLRDDWVAVHEMLHLGIPTIEDHGRWLSEGLATYYEPLLRARAGLLEPDKVWETLHEGFGRGARQCEASTLTLRQDSDTMDKTRRYWRVYWSGAAIALLADVALRQRNSSLDHELARMRDCCLDRSRALEVDELLSLSIAGAKLPGHQAAPAPPGLAATAAPHLDSPEFPDVSAAYQALGLAFDAKGRLQASDDPRAAALRDAMTRAARPAQPR